MHVKETNKIEKNSTKNTKNKWRHVYVEIQDGCYFCKFMSIPIHRCIDRSNPLRIGRDVIF